MGMFDTIYIDYPLPEPRPPDNEYQTKAFHCQLADYKLDADGVLWRMTDGCFADDDNPRTKPLRIEHHGWVNVGSVRPAGICFDYNLKFTDGVCVEARPHPKNGKPWSEIWPKEV